MSEEYLDCSVEVKPVQTEDETSDPGDRRTTERMADEGVTTAVRQTGSHKPGTMHSVSVLDIGSGGISFESAAAMSTGQKVELSMDTPVRNGVKAVGRVKYCIRWAGGFRIGVEFIEINPSDQKALTREFFEPPH